MNLNVAYFLGYALGDRTEFKSLNTYPRAVITTRLGHENDRMIALAHKIGCPVEFDTYHHVCSNGVTLKHLIVPPDAREWLSLLNPKRLPEQLLPEFEEKCAFLAGIWDADGQIRPLPGKPHYQDIRTNHTSFELMDGLKRLALDLRIDATYTTNQRHYSFQGSAGKTLVMYVKKSGKARFFRYVVPYMVKGNQENTYAHVLL